MIKSGKTKKHSNKLAKITLITTRIVYNLAYNSDIKKTEQPATVVKEAAVTGPSILVAPKRSSKESFVLFIDNHCSAPL